MSIDELTTDLIQTFKQFQDVCRLKEARDRWSKYYQEARKYRGTIIIHCIDLEAYDYANRQLRQYYESIMRIKN